MAVNLSFIGGAGWQFLDNSGNPLSGGKIYTYAAGTTTPQVTYTSRTGLVANTNPIILDAAGRTPEQIWATEGLLYKYVVADSNDVIIRTWDNIGGSVVASDLAQDLANTTNNAKGDALIGFKQSDSSGFLTGATAGTVNKKLQEIVSPRDFGAVGDGTTDDSAAFQLAVNCGRKTIDLGGYTYAIANTVTMDADNQTMFNGKLIFTGTSAASGGTERIIDVDANGVTLENIVFDGNANVTEPANALVYVNNDCQNLAIRSCTFQNITSYKYLNNIYGLQVSSYGVVNFEISNCLFKSLYIYNNGTTGPEVIAGNFVGGLFFYPIPPASGLQPTATRGLISDCIFTDIKSIVNNDDYIDADAIRTSPTPNFDQRLYITVDNCLFHTVQGRAFKGNTEGATVQNCVVQPFMETAPGSGVSMSRGVFTISHNTVLRNIRITRGDLPVRGGVQFNALDATGFVPNYGTTIENIYVGSCQIGLNLRVDAVSTGPLENITIRDVTIDSVSSSGIRLNGPTEAAIPTSQRNIVIENVKIKGQSGIASIEGIAFFGNNTTSTGGYFFNNIEIENAYAFWEGQGFNIDGLKMIISSTTTAIVNFYYLSFQGSNYSVKNLEVNALGINNNFLTALKPYFIGIAGFSKSIENFVLRVPDTLESAYPHVQFLGRDSSYQNIDYYGPGFFNMDSSSFYGSAYADNARWTFSNVNRFGSGATTYPFLTATQTAPIASQYGFINGVADFRPTSGNTIQITTGSDYVIYNVASNSSTTIVSSVGSTTTANVNSF